MVAVAKRTGRSSANSADDLVLSDRSDGGGEPVMTVDLYGSGGPGPRLGWRRRRDFMPYGGRRYILMPERPGSHNYTIGLVGVFRVLRTFQRFVIFKFDTPEGRPYKRGSRDERGHRKAPRTTKWRWVLGPGRCPTS